MPEPLCGTVAGHVRHLKTGEEACDACRRAKAEYQAMRRKAAALGRPLMTDAFGSQRRVRALWANGWTRKELAQRIGMHKRTMDRLIDTIPAKKISRLFAERIVLLYDFAEDSRGASRTLKWAVKKEAAPTLAWDNETIDDPNAQPADWRRPERGTNRAEDIARDAAELMSYGESPEGAATRLGVTVGSMQTAIRRAALRAERSA